MTGPEHAREALRLAEYAEQEDWPLDHGGTHSPTEDERHRVMLRAHLHASLARTAALTDTTRWHTSNGTEVHRDKATQDAWHDLFDVKH